MSNNIEIMSESGAPVSRPTSQRNIVCFEPCGPVAAMLELEVKNKIRGTRTKLLEAAVAEHLGKRYPKLMARYLVLLEETN